MVTRPHLQLLEVKPTDSNETIAKLIAETLTETEPLLYCFRINHDVRAAAARSGRPRTGRCPLEYDWAHAESVGIETRHKKEAWQWLYNAAKLGYVVARVDSKRRSTSPHYCIEDARKRAEYHQRPKDLTDDDIPF